MAFRKCAVCEEVIKYEYRLCAKHYYEYGFEPEWVKALIQLRTEEYNQDVLDERHGKMSWDALREGGY